MDKNIIWFGGINNNKCFVGKNKYIYIWTDDMNTLYNIIYRNDVKAVIWDAGMNDLFLLQQINNIKIIYPEIQFILISDISCLSINLKAIYYGFDNIIIRPIDPKKLLEYIEYID